MRICDLCHGLELVKVCHISCWQPETEHPSAQEWDLCEECRAHVKETIQAVLKTKRGRAAEGVQAVPEKRARSRKAKQFEGAT